MNFRGSTGYGREFWESSFKEWGRAMQDDITDGVQWLIDEGIANPDYIAIYGGSYGGYATLAGVTFTPDLYACGVDYVGPSNIFTLLESFPPYWELYREMFYEMVGDPEEDKELLEAASPLFHVDNIKVPLFIAQGANDPRVKQAEADQIVAALEEKGIEYEYLLKENEGHGFRNEENRFDFYRAMEEFLQTHIGGERNL
jgi:dipeptidyl aminopeptidase/acylaminoacyl peptidase